MSDTAEKVTHSPLPWAVDGDAIRSVDGCSVVFAAGGLDRGWAYGPRTRANAEFIVRCVNHHAELVEALTKLTNEIAGLLAMAGPEVREVIGYTNTSVLKQRRDESQAVLAKVGK